MAFWVDVTLPPTAFTRKQEELRLSNWHDDGSSRLFGPTPGTTQDLAGWLQSQTESDATPLSENLLVLPYESNTMSATHDQMDTLARLWKIPHAIIAMFGAATDMTPCPSTIVTSPSGIAWLFLAMKPGISPQVRRQPQAAPFSARSDVMIAFPLRGYGGGSGETFLPNCVVMCPRSYYQKIEDAATTCQSMPGAQGPLNVWKFLVLVLAELEMDWRVSYVAQTIDFRTIEASVARFRDSMLSAKHLEVVDYFHAQTSHTLIYLENMNATLTLVENTILQLLERRGEESLELRQIREAITYYNTTHRSVARHYSVLNERLKTMGSNMANIVQINNENYVRANTISMRRLAERSRLETKELQGLAHQSAVDARDMRRLAMLTMAFLPSTVVAAFFSTPFMALDDNLNFKALSQVWIFFLVSAVVTLLTFGISLSWDLYEKRGRESRQDGRTDGRQHPADPDTAILDPPGVEVVDIELDLVRRWQTLAAEHREAREGRGSGSRNEASDSSQ